MQADKKILRIISNELKKRICEMDILTPEIFITFFTKCALQHNISVDDNFIQKYLQDEIIKLANIQDETSTHLKQLSKNTTDAIDAIKLKDKSKLDNVLHETDKLRFEIDELKKSLYKDELTGIHNRKYLNDNFLNATHDYFLNDGLFAIVDLNYFKQVNDTFGHIIGDKVLIFIAYELKRIGIDVIRYGGDEFLVLFDNIVSLTEAIQKLANLRKAVLKKNFKSHHELFKVSYSFGVVEYKKRDLFSNVLIAADEEMYKDKSDIKTKVLGISV